MPKPLALDADLVSRCAGGDADACAELYRRHVEAATRVAQSVTGNAEDAADAVSDAFMRVFRAASLGLLRDGGQFGSYLLRTTHNAAIDVVRRGCRLTPAGTAAELDSTTTDAEPADVLVGSLDASMVAAAFASLPQRWRSVLWLTEVEGVTPRDVAGVLGMSANAVAQLAVRARAALRERYLQAHLAGSRVDERCRATVDQLGAYTAGGLPPGATATLRQHVSRCAACQARVAELEEVEAALRRLRRPRRSRVDSDGAAQRRTAS